jgi:phosphate transport system permease protein
VETSQAFLWFFGGLLPLTLMAYYLGRNKATTVKAGGIHMHSQPDQYGLLALISAALPAIIVAALGTLLYLLGVNVIPVPMLVAGALVFGAGGLWLGLRLVRPDVRARNQVERVIQWIMLVASLISIITTFGILFSILFEALHFFSRESFWYFITGTLWSPEAAFLEGAGRADELAGTAGAQFGAVPLFTGTFIITAIAMGVALPVGLLSAIYMAEYASFEVRAFAKPVLEILAGIPTVVYGFFAAITVAPLIVRAAEALGLDASFNNALAPGLVMGVMIIPFISSLSDDVITAVPQAMREGSLALGTTKAETIRHIVVPAALPGIISATLLGISRALGETMIVVMAAGLRPNLTWNPLEDMTTVTVRIVDALTGDQAFDSSETLSAFALGLILFVVTLTLNLMSVSMIRRFKAKYESSDL